MATWPAIPGETITGFASYKTVPHVDDTLLVADSEGNYYGKLVRYGDLMADFILEVSKGNIPGHKIMRGLGERAAIGTGVLEDLWYGAADVIPEPADIGTAMSIESSVATDTIAGIGAQKIRVDYLDAAGDEQFEVVDMNGTTPVPLFASPRFIQDFQVSQVGTNTVAVGDITIFETATPLNIYSMIQAKGNMGLVPHRMVPKDKTLHLKEWMASEHTANKGGIVRLRSDCTNSAPPVRQDGVFLFKSTIGITGSAVQMPLAYAIPSLSIVKMSAIGTTANAAIVGHWWGVLVDD
jgi:hypothetical protein